MRRMILNAALAVYALVATICGAQTLNITTKSYDNARSSANTSETILTPAAVRKGMRKITSIPVIGDARGEEAQPLVLNDIMILPSMANVVRGVAAATGAAIWQTAPLCMPIKSNTSIDMWSINDHFGALSTGVIDPDTFKLYQVAFCSEDGSGTPQSMRQRMFILDVRTGNILANVLIDATANGQTYSTSPRKQRSALALWSRNGVKFIVICAGSFTESGPNATGWVLMFDTYDNRIKAALAVRSGIWMSSQGPAIDADGFIYAGTGNGSFNGTTDFGESSIKMQFVPPTSTTAASLSVIGAWSPFSDASRECNNPQFTTAPSPLRAVTGAAPGARMPMSTACNNQWTDQDAHLTGTLVERFHQYITAGKDGIGYVVTTQNFPRTQPADFANRKANCAKVALYEFGWNLGVDPCPVDVTTLNQFFGGKTRHQHAPIVQHAAPDGSFYLLMMSENSPLQAWKADAQGVYHYVARSNETASPLAAGMPGGFASLSSNNGQDAIAWVCVPDKDANRELTTGHVYAYDLTTMVAGKPIPMIWESPSYSYNKFAQPIVYKGQLYVLNYDGSVDVYGLAYTNELTELIR